MTRFLLLAFRNVLRNRRRTAMTLTIVSGGVTALLLAGGFFALLIHGIRESTIQNGLGHIQMFNAATFASEERYTLEHGLSDYATLVELARQVPHVRGVAPRIEFFGMISNGRKSPTFMATALDPAADEQMGFEIQLQEGRRLSPGQNVLANEVVLGEGLARSLEAKPGDVLTMMAVTADGALNGIDVEVVGTYTQSIKELDDRAVRMTIPAAQQLLQTDRVGKLILGLDDTDNTDAAYAALLGRLDRPDIVAKKWPELATVYQQVMLMFGAVFLFMCTIVFFMVVMSSANTMLMATFERTREIGTMLAMGTPRGWVCGLFVVEGIFTGLLGAVAGLLLGNGLISLINAANVQIPALPGNSHGFPLHVMQVPELMVGASLLVIGTLSLASVVPAIRASRLRIVESLAHV